MSLFKQATKTKAKLRLTLDGPAGAGKTYSALQMATELGGPIALIDTEHGSASKYADLFRFDTVELADFSPETYVKMLDEAAKASYPVVIVDSLSHAWTGKGGALELVDRLGQGDKFGRGWRAVTPMHNALVESLLAYPGHVIATMRTKMEHIIEEGPGGKKQVRKVGMAPVQRDGMEYEFDVVLDLDHDGGFQVSKTRCPGLPRAGRYADVPGMAKTLKGWLDSGTEAPTKPPGALAAAVAILDPGPVDHDAKLRALAERVRAANGNQVLEAAALKGLTPTTAAKVRHLAKSGGGPEAA
jgi:hypothetical protein